MKNILVPTDFTTNCLDHASFAARQISGKCNIHLFHAFDMPGSLMDAIGRSGIRNHSRLITEELRVRCKRAKSEQTNIANIFFRIMYGTTIYAFKNYIEAHDIDLLYIPEGYAFRPVVRESMDPTVWFRKSGLRVLEVQGGARPADVQEAQDMPRMEPQLANALNYVRNASER